MPWENLDITPMLLFRLGGLAAILILLLLLVISFRSRARVFCQYLKHMAGVDLDSSVVQKAYKANGRGGVRDLLIDLMIQEDLADPSRQVLPGGKPKPSIYEANIFD